MIRAARYLLVFVLVVVLAACLEEESGASSTSQSTPTPSQSTSEQPTDAPQPDEEPQPTSAIRAASTRQADWTVLVYLDGDNNLERAAIADFAEMARVGSSKKLNIIVQLDRIRSDDEDDSTAYGNWATAKRFRVERKMRPTKQNQIADLGELNMGDPETLTDFITWGVKTYPARRYALIFWDHGSSWPGVANDDTSDGDLITLPELTEALKDARKQSGLKRFDLIGFDTCLMGQLDVLEAIAPYGEVAVGSADLVPSDGWAWEKWLERLADDTTQDATTIAPEIVNSFSAFYKRRKDPSVTIAAFDLRKVAEVRERLGDLALEMIDDMDASYKVIGKARSYAESYAAGDEELSPIDLGHFAQLLIEKSQNDAIVDAARALDEAVVSARIAEAHGKEHPNATGMSIYFPRKQKYYDVEYVDGSPLPQQTEWAAFLEEFYRAGKSGTKRAAVNSPVVSDPVVSTTAPLTMRARVTGDDVAYVYYYIGAIDPEQPETLRLHYLDYIYPPGATPNGTMPVWQSGGSNVRLTWTATTWYLSNGQAVIDVPLEPTDYGSNIYSVAGTYTALKTGDEIPVSVEFEVAQGRGTLVHIWGFDEGANAAPQPLEIQPLAGDQFTPEFVTYTTHGDTEEEDREAGQTITFGNRPLIAAQGPAQNGEYVIGLLVEDIAGETQEQYADVTVENTLTEVMAEDMIPAPTPAAGEQAGTLVYDDPALGVYLEYPRDWTSVDSGNDKIVLYQPDDVIVTSLSIDVAALEASGDAANRLLLDEIVDATSALPDLEIVSDDVAVQLAGLDGTQLEYTYTRNGQTIVVTAIAVTNDASGLSYLVTLESPQDTLDQNSPVFERILGTLSIEQ